MNQIEYQLRINSQLKTTKMDMHAIQREGYLDVFFFLLKVHN